MSLCLVICQLASVLFHARCQLKKLFPLYYHFHTNFQLRREHTPSQPALRRMLTLTKTISADLPGLINSWGNCLRKPYPKKINKTDWAATGNLPNLFSNNQQPFPQQNLIFSSDSSNNWSHLVCSFTSVSYLSSNFVFYLFSVLFQFW